MKYSNPTLNNIIKFALGGIGIAVLGVSALLGAQYLRARNDPEYRQTREAEKFMHDWEKQYAEDTYGGTTPEETLSLFIDALKKGDTDLAAKYFAVDKQKEFRIELENLKRKDSLKMMLSDLTKIKLTKETQTEAFFTLIGINGIAEAELIMDVNPITKKWKITEL